MIVDSHLHLWVQNPEKYPWDPIGGYIPENEAPLSQFLDVMKANGVDGAVLVQPTPYGWDNTYLIECKQKDPERFKAVVLVDPLAEKGSRQLHKLKKLGADGVRINLHLQPLEKWACACFYQFWDTCTDLRLPVCLQLTPEHLGFVQHLAGKHHIPIILDHMGRPEPGAGIDDKDIRRLLTLLEMPNIFIKLSGLYYYSQEKAPFQDTWTLLRETKEKFGAQNCMWGSDFPFIEEHWSYEAYLDLVRNRLGFSDDDLLWILGKTSKSIWWHER